MFKMIVCAAPELQQSLSPWMPNLLAEFNHFDALSAYLQQRLLQASNPIPVFLDLNCLVWEQDPTGQIARIHLLSGHKPILLAQSQEFDNLPDTALPHIYSLLTLPLAVRPLQLLQARLQSESERQEQLAAHELRLKKLLEENRQLRERIKQESARDPVTGLLYRQALLERLNDEWRRAHRHEHPISAIAIALRGLPRNSSAAEAFTLEFARRLMAVRASDLAGSPETALFVVVLPLTFHEGALALTGHFRTMLNKLIDKYEFSDATAELVYQTEIPRRHADGPRFLAELLARCGSGQGQVPLLV
ncbi:MAG: hypothetical protein CVV27_14170 [Candidatus Melainabacteria bacterium HGW-Melainabacteria-1]|nr:MAG: hypothetical protein CVV27_14170 [Candidatus Melainabacteria bacterium HGW-Melainabacteria-1]